MLTHYDIYRIGSSKWRLDHPQQSSRLFYSVLDAVHAALFSCVRFNESPEDLDELASKITIIPSVPGALKGWRISNPMNGFIQHSPSGYIGGRDWGTPQSRFPTPEEKQECKKYRSKIRRWEIENIPKH